jgi:DHA2 family multidrug resistance protein
MTCVALFTVSSFLCGLAPSLGMLIFFRILQGVGGGGLQPSEQAILADTFPASKRGMAFAVYGMAVVLAPAIGPTLGGWITDNFTWRWIFYINVPIGILSLFLTNRVVEDPPFLKREQERRRGIRADYVGLGLITIAIASLQIALDKGQESDWFSSRWITSLVILAIYAFADLDRVGVASPESRRGYSLVSEAQFRDGDVFQFHAGNRAVRHDVHDSAIFAGATGVFGGESRGEALAGGGFAMICMLPWWERWFRGSTRAS